MESRREEQATAKGGERLLAKSNGRLISGEGYLGRFESIEAFAELFAKENRLMEKVEPIWLKAWLKLDLTALAKDLTYGLLVVPDEKVGGVHIFDLADPDL